MSKDKSILNLFLNETISLSFLQLDKHAEPFFNNIKVSPIPNLYQIIGISLNFILFFSSYIQYSFPQKEAILWDSFLKFGRLLVFAHLFKLRFEYMNKILMTM